MDNCVGYYYSHLSEYFISLFFCVEGVTVVCMLLHGVYNG